MPLLSSGGGGYTTEMSANVIIEAIRLNYVKRKKSPVEYPSLIRLVAYSEQEHQEVLKQLRICFNDEVQEEEESKEYQESHSTRHKYEYE